MSSIPITDSDADPEKGSESKRGNALDALALPRVPRAGGTARAA
jgi:hypothetical protein